jgi:hypothetical protein
MKDKIKPTRKNYDTFEANSNSYERARLMKAQIKALKNKSPDVSKLVGIRVPELRATFYPSTEAKRQKKIALLEKMNYKYEIINTSYKNNL